MTYLYHGRNEMKKYFTIPQDKPETRYKILRLFSPGNFEFIIRRKGPRVKFEVTDENYPVLLPPFMDFQYTIGTAYQCPDFDTNPKVCCSNGFYATHLDGIFYSVSENNNVLCEVQVWGNAVEINFFKMRYEYIRIVRCIPHDEVFELLKKNKKEMIFDAVTYLNIKPHSSITRRSITAKEEQLVMRYIDLYKRADTSLTGKGLHSFITAREIMQNALVGIIPGHSANTVEITRYLAMGLMNFNKFPNVNVPKLYMELCKLALRLYKKGICVLREAPDVYMVFAGNYRATLVLIKDAAEWYPSKEI